MKILILGASYGSLLGTKLAMAGHDVTLVCREATAALINAEGTVVRLQPKRGDAFRQYRSADLPGRVDAATPDGAAPGAYDMVALAMQEPQYGAPAVAQLMARVAAARVPCLSIMNMPPLPFLRRIEALRGVDFAGCYADPSVWAGFEPALVSLCSPDPQAFRPPDEAANVLQVGLASNFKATAFGTADATDMLRRLDADIAAVRVDGQRVPVRLMVSDSLFAPMAKWSMLLTGNYRCILEEGVQSIREAVHGDAARSRAIYGWVDGVARSLGAGDGDLVPFESYARAAENLGKPSSVARAVDGGATAIERVDRLVRTIALARGMDTDAVDGTVARVDRRLAANATA